MRKPGAMLATAAAMALAATAAQAGPIRPGEIHDALGLGLIGPKIPAALKAAKDAPYATPASANCEGIAQEIEKLNDVLGPDAHQPGPKTTMQKRAGKLLTSTVRGFIPHRDVVRFVTQAGKHEKALSDAAMAGWARRGFLRGMQVSLACPDAIGAPAASSSPEPAIADPALTVASAPAPAAPAAAPEHAALASAKAPAIPVIEPAPAAQPMLVRTFVAPTQIAADATLTR